MSFLDDTASVVIGDSDEDEIEEVPETPDSSFINDGSTAESEQSSKASSNANKIPEIRIINSEEDSPILARRKVYAVVSSDDEGDESKSPNPSESIEDVDVDEDEIERKIEKYAFSPKTRKSLGVARRPLDSESETDDDDSSRDVNENSFLVADGFSSTMMVPRGGDVLLPPSPIGSTTSTKQESDDSLQLVEEKITMINISDDSPENTAGIVIQDTPRQSLIIPGSARKSMVQSRITDFGKVAVPKDIFVEEQQKLEEMTAQVSQQENLYKTVGKAMFDKGEKLLNYIQTLKRDVEEQRRSVERLEVVEALPSDVKPSARPLAEIKNLNWDQLEGMLGSEKPKHFGKQGIKTFEDQKALTMDALKEIHGSLNTCPGETEMLETPRTLKVELMGHQKHALAFMKWREAQRPRGGLLADDMGLGKTLTMLSLMAADLEDREKENAAGEEEEGDSDEEEDEENESLSKEKQQPKKKGMTGWSAKGRKDFYDGGNLVVCPASLLQQWEGEVKSKLKKNALNYLVYHGSNRDMRGRSLSEYDLVITTYSIASVDKKTNIGLYRVKWRRIILDEGHAIRNHKSQMSIAACELMSRRRWVLTGTPIHNKEMDIYAVLKFLRCQPFNDLLYFKKWIDNKTESGKQRLNTLLKSIMLRRTKAELQAKGALQSLPEKRTEVIEVRLDKDEMNIYQRVMIYSKTLFAQFLHQRAEKQADGMMGRREGDPHSVYYALHKKMQRMNKVQTDEVKQFQILVLLLRLRQICCHPGLINAMLDDPELSMEGTEDGEDHSEVDLLNQLEKLTIEEGQSEGSLERSQEAEMEAGGEGKKEKILVASNPAFDLKKPSSKMRRILETVDELLAKGDDKIVIVSQWSSVLNILEKYTEEQRIPTTKLTGAVMVKNRQQIVESFNKKGSGPRILFLSLTAGGVGLNLVGGNHLFLIDLHWNPQLEKQAQDRVYRFGQEKPVTIYKFMVVDSIEQRIKELQDRKLQLADAVLTGTKAASGSKLTIADLKTLFDMN